MKFLKKILSGLCLLIVIISIKAIASNITLESIEYELSKDIDYEEYAKLMDDYWTPERMSSAIPMQQILDGVNKNVIEKDVEDTVSITYYVNRNNYSKYPHHRIGKLFYRDDSGNNWQCSGSITNNNTIVTAGHCISDGRGNFYNNFMFVPSYYEGDEPYSRWHGRRMRVPTTWHNNRNRCRDLGTINPYRQNGRSISSRGFLGLASGKTPFHTWRMFGYPGTHSSGEKMLGTHALYQGYDRDFSCNSSDPAAIGIITTQGSGSSGGPRFNDQGPPNPPGDWPFNLYIHGVNAYSYSTPGPGAIQYATNFDYPAVEFIMRGFEGSTNGNSVNPVLPHGVVE